MKKFVRQRFIERVLNPPRTKVESIAEETEVVHVPEQFEEGGRIYSRVIAKRVPVSDKFKDLKVSDFHMQNVIAAGAVSNLKECYLSGQSLDSLDSALNTATQILDSFKPSQPVQVNSEPQSINN